MKSIAKLLVFVLMIAVLSPTTFGAQISTLNIAGDTTADTRTISGITDAGVDKEVTILATKPGTTTVDENSIVYINQVTSGINGSYTFDFKMPSTALPGMYELKVGGTDVASPKATPFPYGSFTVNASVSGGNGSVSPTATVVPCGTAPTFTITPIPGYKIASVTFNGSVVLSHIEGSQTYQPNSITANPNSGLVATFEKLTPSVPNVYSSNSIANGQAKIYSMKRKSDNTDINIQINKSVIKYATVIVPDGFTATEQGMILKDETVGSTRKSIELPARVSTSGQFAIQIFAENDTPGTEDTSEKIFKNGDSYSLMPYVKYDNGGTIVTVLGAKQIFTWN